MRRMTWLESRTLTIGLGSLLAACSGSGEGNCRGAVPCLPGGGDAGLGGERGPMRTIVSAETEQDGGAPLEQSPPFERAQPVNVPPERAESDRALGMPGDAGVPAPPGPRANRRVDVLFMIDNSISMGDKQGLLDRGAAEFVNHLINPPCVDDTGQRSFPPGPDAPCEPGSTREFLPVDDIHVGVISSSLGDRGADAACPAGDERDDRAHLIGSLPRGQGHGTNAAGVLEFRPGSDAVQLTSNLQGLLASVGQNGCGWEMSLESWLRFAIDPFPYERLERVPCPGTTAGGANCVQPATDADNRVLLDADLLEQRAAFLRPDSLLAIVMLSDENDCSLQLGRQSWVVTAIDDPRPMFRGSSRCESNPNDACCYSCPLGPPPGCAVDPICEGDASTGTLPNRLPAAEDGRNLRCFDQKRRFGVDFLYPTERYVNALRELELCPTALDLAPRDCATQTVANPLFAGGRDPSSVFLSGIVGVPWQEIAAEASSVGQPLDEEVLRFKSSAELGDAGWTALVGAPPASPPLPPSSPFMVESSAPRTNISTPNPVNGRDHAPRTALDGAPDDLQYACIFPLPEPRDCSVLDPGGSESCECFPGNNDRPLCEVAPGQSAPGTTQFYAQAYPGLRQLEVLRGQGENAALGSICARNVSDATRADYGYRPAFASLLERMQRELRSPG